MRGGERTEGMRKDGGREGRMEMRTEETCGEKGGKRRSRNGRGA